VGSRQGYKLTQIGEIPEEWEVVKLGDICSERKEKVQPSGKGLYRYIGLEHINPGETKLRQYTFDTEVKSTKACFYQGDILYGKLRPYLDKAVHADFDGICSTDIIPLLPKERAISEFIVYLVHSNSFVGHAISTTAGTNHPRTSWKAISRFKLPFPPLPEQREIAEILSTVDEKIEVERQRKEKLEELKRGLMQVLLTGKVRVKVA